MTPPPHARRPGGAAGGVALVAVVALLAILAGGLAAAATPPAPSTARPADALPQVVDVPASSTLTVEGHGFGNGIGLSQWGAEGAASRHASATAILDFYYPHTVTTRVADRTIRVLVDSTAAGLLEVAPAAGLVATDAASGASVPLPTTGAHAYRVASVSGGLLVQEQRTGHPGWTTLTLRANGKARELVAGPVTLAATAPSLVLLDTAGGGEAYQGRLIAARTGTGTLDAVDALPLEDYVAGVVPHEADPSWLPAALQAQAVAARTYALYEVRQTPPGQPYQICSTDFCQVYEGVALVAADGTRTPLQYASTTAATTATAGEIRTYQGQPIYAGYGASDGGWTVADGVAYLPAKADPYDGIEPGSETSWSVPVAASTLAADFGLHSLTQVRVLSRDGHGAWGGRVGNVDLVGATSSGAPSTVATTGSGVAGALGLMSTWWNVGVDDSALSARSPAPSLYTRPGPDTETLTATFRNTGTTDWDLAALAVATSGPGARAVVAGAAPPVDLTHPGATAAVPGDSVEVSVRVDTAAFAAGSYPLDGRLSDGSGPFGATVRWPVRVATAVLAAVQVGPAPNVTVSPDGTDSVTLTFRNTGNVAWPAGALVRLGLADPHVRTDPLRGPGWLLPRRPGVLDPVASAAAPGATPPTTTPPGGTATITFALAGNGLPAGSRTDAFQPVWDGVRWFGPVVVLTVDVT